MAEQAMTAAEATEANAAASHDTPGNPTTLSYVIVAQARTGSTMLEERLRARGLGTPFEYLNPRLMALLARRWSGRETLPFARYLEQLKANRTTPNGVFGFKCLVTQVEATFTSGAEARGFLLGFDRIVILCRRDKLAQAVSALRAEQTGQWTSALAPSGPDKARFDALGISRRIHRFLAQDRALEQMKLEAVRPVLRLQYEAVRDAPEAEWARLQEFLGFEPAPAGSAPPAVQPQREALSEEWERRYLALIRGTGDLNQS
jgi:LPS sulfotransferase NodH